MKLYKKADKPMVRTTCWLVQKSADGRVVRKQITFYNSTIEEILGTFTKDFVEK